MPSTVTAPRFGIGFFQDPVSAQAVGNCLTGPSAKTAQKNIMSKRAQYPTLTYEAAGDQHVKYHRRWQRTPWSCSCPPPPTLPVIQHCHSRTLHNLCDNQQHIQHSAPHNTSMMIHSIRIHNGERKAIFATTLLPLLSSRTQTLTFARLARLLK